MFQKHVRERGHRNGSQETIFDRINIDIFSNKFQHIKRKSKIAKIEEENMMILKSKLYSSDVFTQLATMVEE